AQGGDHACRTAPVGEVVVGIGRSTVAAEERRPAGQGSADVAPEGTVRFWGPRPCHSGGGVRPAASDRWGPIALACPPRGRRRWPAQRWRGWRAARRLLWRPAVRLATASR